MWKGIRATPTPPPKKNKQNKKPVLRVCGCFLFASPALSEPLFGVLSCLNLLVCLRWCSGRRVRPRGGQGPVACPGLLCTSSTSRLLNELPDCPCLPRVDLLLCLFLFFISFQVSSSSRDTLSLVLGVVCPVSPRGIMRTGNLAQ